MKALSTRKLRVWRRNGRNFGKQCWSVQQRCLAVDGWGKGLEREASGGMIR
mgnify:CR=1 FL=1